jgi:hypothetical protein
MKPRSHASWMLLWSKLPASESLPNTLAHITLWNCHL